VLCFTFFSWYPIVREVTMSLQKAVPGGGNTWAGLDNYIRIFHDPTFWQAWRNPLEFTVLALVVGYAVPFCVAVLLNELRHARGYLRALVYLPVMLPPASALLLFAYFYNPQYGLFDHILRILHLPTSQWVLQPGTGFVSTAMVSVVIASTWMNMGAATLIYLAALQNIPASCTRRRSWTARGVQPHQARYDPATRLILLMLLLLQVVATMQMFVESFVLTNGGGGVGDNTQSVVMLMYQYAFALSGASNYNSASGSRGGPHGGFSRSSPRVPSGSPASAARRLRWRTRHSDHSGCRPRRPAAAGACGVDQDPDLQRAAEPAPRQDHLPGRPHRGHRGVHAGVHRPLYFLFTDGLKSTAESIADAADAVSASPAPGYLRAGLQPAGRRQAAVEHPVLRIRRAGVPARLRRRRCYALSKLRPVLGGVIFFLMLATLMIPPPSWSCRST